MMIYTRNNSEYRLPSALSDFQRDMYVHLIDWKRKNLTKEAGYYRHNGEYIPYDAILPDSFKVKYYPIYRPIVERFKIHQKNFSFKSHKFIGHMASSQAACANLFLPILQDTDSAAKILSSIKTDLKSIATDYLDSGFRIEFWDEHNLLGDHNKATGTDSDIAIAYRDKNGNLNLWLIEHKLTKREFTTCGGFKSKGRTNNHSCELISDILQNPDLCYYHSSCRYNYWNITLENSYIFPVDKLQNYEGCPSKDGMNQLWRNQVLALAVEKSKLDDLPCQKVFFSVVYHPKNESLATSLKEFEELTNYTNRFFHFSSDKLIEAAKNVNTPDIKQWRAWYEDLYYY